MADVTPTERRASADVAARESQGQAVDAALAEIRRIAAITDDVERAAQASAFARTWNVPVKEALTVRRAAMELLLGAGMQKQDVAALVGVSPPALSHVKPRTE